MELYHLLNRGVDKRITFEDDSDRLRFLHDMFVFNDVNPVDSNHRRKGTHKTASERERLVNIHSFALMPNHYHMLVEERVENGISFFMRKLNMGYAKYFNDKHKRSGVLWQGTFKKVPIVKDAHFLYIPYYIHLNPLDLTTTKWRTGSVKNTKAAIAKLFQYRWSSFLDYNSKTNFPSLIQTNFLSEILGSTERQKEVIARLINDPHLAQQSYLIE